MPLRVLVSSGGQSVNAIEARLTYNPKELSVTSVSVENSVVTSWVQPAQVDAELGEIVFGGSLSTSAELDRDLVVTLHIKPLRAGEARIRFENGAAIHAADGLGSNILTSLSGGQYIINPKELNSELNQVPTLETPPSTIGEVLGVATETPVVLITSATHPDQSAWYNASSSVFAFNFEKEISSLRLGFNKNENGVAGVPYAQSVKEKTIDDLEEGIWYLHLSADVRNGGVFSTKYRVQVDQSPPQGFTFSQVEGSDKTNPNLVFGVNATDTLSGVDYYTFSTDNSKPEVWRDDGTHQYRYRATGPGTYQIIATVFDKAGNTSTSTLSFEVGYLDVPIVALVDGVPREGTPLTLSLGAMQGNLVNVSIARDGDEPVIEKFTVDASGKANVTSTYKFSPGKYQIWASAEDANGGVSKESDHVSLEVSPSLWGLISRHPFALIALLALVLLSVFGVHVWKNLYTVKRAGASAVPASIPPLKSQIEGRVILQARTKGARINVSRVTT